jgi:hypothetical protein
MSFFEFAIRHYISDFKPGVTAAKDAAPSAVAPAIVR